MVSLLQAATSPPALGGGQLATMLGAAVAFTALVAGAFRLGAISERMTRMESSVVESLKQLNGRFAAVERFISDSIEKRNDWSGWRADTTRRLETAEGEIERVRDRAHGLAGEIQGILSRQEVTERRDVAAHPLPYDRRTAV